ncbi:MAG: endopeptidase La [Saprospiraceae bacterium]|nr:endopeptidase La [Saprospiraceae bacterium]
MFDDLLIKPGFEDETEYSPILTLEDEEEVKNDEVIPDLLPILALKNTVLFPGIVIPITVGRNKSIKAIRKAYDSDKLIGVLSQIDSKIENPADNDLYRIGTIARIMKILRMPDGTTTAILQGRRRFYLNNMVSESPYMQGAISTISYEKPINELEFDAMISSIKDLSRQIIELSNNIPSEAIVMLKNITNNNFLLNFIASNSGIKIEEKQKILEISNLEQKAKKVLVNLDNELQLLKLKDKIENKVRTDLDKQQREYFLNQQLKTIQEELGNQPGEDDITKFIEKAEKIVWPIKAKEVFDKEINKLRRMNPQMSEYSVMLNYVELLTDLPWENYSKDNFDLKNVKKVLDKDHFGLEKVKERIIEHLAVLKLKGDMKAPILCLVGPPGVGKTSLGNSIASALNRKYVRMSLGGLHDESEIRGHRKTYIGAMPGRILQSLKKSGTSNPVFILDEIDKIGKDFRGDPSSALLEVLDPEQNTTFHDNYLDFEYDLSKVLFIATANSLNTIQPALLDRMEIIEISGYSNEEKKEIAIRHLVPQQRENHGLKESQLKIDDDAIDLITKKYTRESGVRSLNRQIAAVIRNVATKIAMGTSKKVHLKLEDVEPILGPPTFNYDIYSDIQEPGVAVGLAWTSVGGDILFIESNKSPGKGKLTLTGNLGDVMKESATTALSYLKANAIKYHLDPKIFDETDIHIHIPEGAIPKDGPSAGITMLSALTSLLLNKKIKPHLAMTGEITLRGKVLPVGGIKEKILAAKRSNLNEIILCSDNKKHIEEIPKDYIKDMVFHYVNKMEDVIKIAIEQ